MKLSDKEQLVRINSKIRKSYRKRIDALIAARPGATLQDVLDSALGEYFGEGGPSDAEIVAAHLQRLSRETEGVASDIQSIGEMLALFIENWFVFAPELPEDSNLREQQISAGQARANNFYRGVAERMREQFSTTSKIERLSKEFEADASGYEGRE